MPTMQSPELANGHRRVVIAVAAVVVVALGIWVLRRFEPASSSFYPKCMLHEWTGLHCPGCGTTRALGAIVRGQPGDAVRFNPMLIIGGPIIAGAIWVQRRRERLGAQAAPRLAWILFVVLMIYFVARNVPSPTRSWLAPPQPPTAQTDTP